MSNILGRPVPKPDLFVATTPFWQAAQNGKLLLQFCEDTQSFQHYPRPVSVQTGSRNLAWREVSGLGHIYAATIVRVGPPGLAGRLPLFVALVELDEKVRIIANILGAAPDTVKIGARVCLAWDRLDGNVAYPAFQLAPPENPAC